MARWISAAVGLLIAMAMGQSAAAQCGGLEDRADRLQVQLDDLQIDYPITYSFFRNTICHVNPNTPWEDVAARITVNYLGCALIAGEDDCNYVIEQVFDIGGSESQIGDLAERRGCFVEGLDWGC